MRQVAFLVRDSCKTRRETLRIYKRSYVHTYVTRVCNTKTNTVGGLDVRRAHRRRRRSRVLEFGCVVVTLTDIASASFFYRWPQIREDHPPNLSILVSGGKETNQDFLSSGERTGMKPSTESRRRSGGGRCGVREVPLSRRDHSCPSSS